MNNYKTYLQAKGYSTSTAEVMTREANKFIIWYTTQNIEITMITYNDITAYVKLNQQRNIALSSVYKITNYVKHYLNYLVESGEIPSNPALKLKLKNTKRKTVVAILSNEELETIYKNYSLQIPSERSTSVLSSPCGGVRGGKPPQELNKLSRKRNKVILGLLIYQGLATEDIINMTIQQLNLREGKLTIPSRKRSNERTLKLESHQIFDLSDYINDTRKAILSNTNKKSDAMFISTGKGIYLNNTLQHLTNEIKAENKNVINLNHIRASVITNWLKQYNKRKVQYMAGHRYVSSTEAYEASNIETLQEDIERFYPIL